MKFLLGIFLIAGLANCAEIPSEPSKSSLTTGTVVSSSSELQAVGSGDPAQLQPEPKRRRYVLRLAKEGEEQRKPTAFLNRYSLAEHERNMMELRESLRKASSKKAM